MTRFASPADAGRAPTLTTSNATTRSPSEWIDPSPPRTVRLDTVRSGPSGAAGAVSTGRGVATGTRSKP